MTCGPEHVVFTAARLAEARGCAAGDERKALLAQLMENARDLLDRSPTPWQRARASAADAAGGAPEATPSASASGESE